MFCIFTVWDSGEPSVGDICTETRNNTKETPDFTHVSLQE